jgi:ArsR family transcriptional regulator
MRPRWPTADSGTSVRYSARFGRHLTHQRFLVYDDGVTTTVALDLTRAARLFHALSDETRLGIVEMLRGGERCVCDLQADLDAAQSRLSFHLKVLKEAGLVTDRKEGRWSYYTLVPEAFGEAHDLVRALATEGRAGGRTRLKVFGRCCG